jgi:predicted phosphodiesterase
MPDFLNVDCDFPQPGWEDALSYILESVKNENPDFLVVAGDLVMGHWDHEDWHDQDTIRKYSNRYYTAWINRMKHHGLKFFTTIGDHEVGDNPWRSAKKLEAVKLYKKAFAQHLQMPENGPEHMMGTAFWWRHKNVVFISTDVFEEGSSDQGLIKAGVTGEQLAWVNRVLMENADAHHKIVLGHTPILGPVRKWSSSGLMIKEGRDSEFWQTMKKHGVDIYLCGEVHAITCTERDGIMQIAHGGLIGYNTRTNYLVAHVTRDKIELEIKEIEMLPHGEHLWQTKQNRPLEMVTISQEHKTRGFYLVGTATIDKTVEKQFTNRKGYFLTRHETSSEGAVPIFKKDNERGAPFELPKITIEEVPGHPQK